MYSQQIQVKLNRTSTKVVSQKNQYQDWIARFCYAAAKLPPNTVEHILDLMETCGDDEGAGLKHKEGNA